MTFRFFRSSITRSGEDRLPKVRLHAAASSSRYVFENLARVDFPQEFDCPVPVTVPFTVNMVELENEQGASAFYFLEYAQGITSAVGPKMARAHIDVFSTYTLHTAIFRGIWRRGHVCGYANGANPPKPRTVTAQSGDVKFPYPSSDATVQKVSALMGYEDTYRLVIFATAGDTNPGAIETYADGEKICLFSADTFGATSVTDSVAELATASELYNLLGVLRTKISTLDAIYAIPAWIALDPATNGGFTGYNLRDVGGNTLLKVYAKGKSAQTLFGVKATIDSMNDQALVCGAARIEIPSVCVSGDAAEYGVRFTSAITPNNITLSMAYGAQSADITQYFKVPFYWRDEGTKQERDIQAVLGAGLGLLGMVGAGAGGLGAVIGATGLIAGAAQAAGTPTPTFFGSGSYPGAWLTYPSEYENNTVFGGPVLVTYRRTLAAQYQINAYGGVGDVPAGLTLQAALQATGYKPKWLYAEGEVELAVAPLATTIPSWAHEEITKLFGRGVRFWDAADVDTTAVWWQSRYSNATN